MWDGADVWWLLLWQMYLGGGGPLAQPLIRHIVNTAQLSLSHQILSEWLSASKNALFKLLVSRNIRDAFRKKRDYVGKIPKQGAPPPPPDF